MKFQQTRKSGGGGRYEGIRIPGAEAVAARIGEEALNAVVDKQHPGLRGVLDTLWTMMGGAGCQARATIDPEMIAKAAVAGVKDLEDLPTAVLIKASNAKSAAVLHEILRLGVDAYLNEHAAECRHCDEPLGHRPTAQGEDLVWFHRATGKIMCADGEHVALKRRRRRDE